MAEIQVSSWSDFLLAVQESGADVVLPENAVWDMNEIEPEGVSSLPEILCTNIYGNNTQIRNLRSSAAFAFSANGQPVIDSLHFINTVADVGIFHAPAYGQLILSGCKISGLFGAQAQGVVNTGTNRNASAIRCAFVCDSQRAGTFSAVNIRAKYCRIHIAVPNGTFLFPSQQEWSYFRIDQPQATTLACTGATACVYDGQMQNVTAAGEPGHDFISIFNSDGAPQIEDTAYLKGVTTAQLRDPQYLASIGFPIGYDPPEQ